MSTINLVAHGLTAGQRVAFSDLVGGSPIDTDFVYFVMAAGLTADAFQISETDDGAALSFATMTSANMQVVPETTDGDTYPIGDYVPITDPTVVMAPPTVPTTPPTPTLGTTTVNTVVVLTVNLTDTDTAPVRNYELQVTMATGPDWTQAITYALPQGTTGFTLPAHPSTTYYARVRKQDVYGNFSAWSGTATQATMAGYDSLSAFAAASASLASLLDHPITTTEIADDSISTPKLQANSVTASILSAVIVLASVIKTAASGSRVEISSSGIRSYNGSTLIVNVPTDGSNVYIAAEVQASALTVTGDASLRGSGSEVAASGVLTLQSTVANPVTAPSLTQDWDTLSVPLATWSWSMDYDPAGGAGGATKVFWGVKEMGYIGEYLCSNRTLNRSKLADGVSDVVWGVCRHGSYVYVLYHPDGSATWNVRRFLASTLALNATYAAVSFPRATPEAPSIASDGTNIFIADRAAADNHLLWNKYDATMVKVGATIDTGVAFTSTVLDIYTGNADFGAWRLVAVSNSQNQTFVFNSTGARQVNNEFPLVNVSYAWSGITYGDAVGDGARFWSAFDGMAYILKHTTWNWTTASSIYWVAYSWYDSVGTTHETLVGPRASITMGKRKRLLVTTPVEPGSGGANDPDNRRIYAYPNATAPATTLLDLQATTTAESTYLTTYNSAGAAPPVVNGFPAGTPAQIKSADSGWVLKGNGLINRYGTAFPASPVTNDQFWRSDLGMEFYWDGTRWLSVTVFESDLPQVDNISATETDAKRVRSPDLHGGSDIWIENAYATFYVSGGTALSASHKWTIAARKLAVTTGTVTSFGQLVINSGASSTWREANTVIAALQNAGTTHVLYTFTATKLGTPGNLYAYVKVTYRIVAT